MTRDRRQDFDSGFDICNSTEENFSNSDDLAPPCSELRNLGCSTPTKPQMVSPKLSYEHHKLPLTTAHNIHRQSNLRPNSVDSFASVDGVEASIESDDTGVVLSAASGKCYAHTEFIGYFFKKKKKRKRT